MAHLCLTTKSTVRPTVSVNGSRLPPVRVLAAPTRFTPKRDLIKRYSSDSGEKNDDKLVSDSGEVLQGRQEMKTSPMSEDKRAQTPEQGGAPEGDRAVAGQAYQPTGDSDVASPEAGEKRTGSASQSAGEAAQQEQQQNEDRAPLQD